VEFESVRGSYFGKGLSERSVESVCGLLRVSSVVAICQPGTAIDMEVGWSSPMSKHFKIGRETMRSVCMKRVDPVSATY
jgi:hypothetical protein